MNRGRHVSSSSAAAAVAAEIEMANFDEKCFFVASDFARNKSTRERKQHTTQKHALAAGWGWGSVWLLPPWAQRWGGTLADFFSLAERRQGLF
jgi:hypothetical protein